MKLQTSVSGGGKLANRLRQIQARFEKNKGVLIGVPKGTGAYEDGVPIAVIAAVHEFGRADGSIPERSFLRVPLRQNMPEFNRLFRVLMPKVMSGELTMFQAMSQMGAKAAAASQEAISAGITPGNAEATVERKGSSKPLIDTGSLRQAITYIVEE